MRLGNEMKGVYKHEYYNNIIIFYASLCTYIIGVNMTNFSIFIIIIITLT